MAEYEQLIEDENGDFIPEPPKEEDDGAYTTITFKFNSEEDLRAFSELIGQKVNRKMKTIWFPELDSALSDFME